MAIVTPNMGLTVPVAGDTTPGYVNSVTGAFTSVDAHDHSTGKGVRIPAGSLNWSTLVDANGQAIQNLQTTRYADQASLSAASFPRALYTVGGDLYFNTGYGTALRITTGGSLNGALLGGIVGQYVSSGAIVTYDNPSATYAFQGPGASPANLSAKSITVTNVATAQSLLLTSAQAVVTPSTTRTYRVHPYRGVSPTTTPTPPSLFGFDRPTAVGGTSVRWYVPFSTPNYGVIPAARALMYCTGAGSGTVAVYSLSATDGTAAKVAQGTLAIPASPGGNFTLTFTFGTPLGCNGQLFYFDFTLTPATGAANNISIVGCQYDITASQLPDVFGG